MRKEVIVNSIEESIIDGFEPISDKLIPYTEFLGDEIFKAKGHLYTIVSTVISEKTMEKIEKIEKLRNALDLLVYFKKKKKKYIVGDF